MGCFLCFVFLKGNCELRSLNAAFLKKLVWTQVCTKYTRHRHLKLWPSTGPENQVFKSFFFCIHHRASSHASKWQKRREGQNPRRFLLIMIVLEQEIRFSSMLTQAAKRSRWNLCLTNWKTQYCQCSALWRIPFPSAQQPPVVLMPFWIWQTRKKSGWKLTFWCKAPFSTSRQAVLIVSTFRYHVNLMVGRVLWFWSDASSPVRELKTAYKDVSTSIL